MERSTYLMLKLNNDKDIYFPGEVIAGKVELKVVKHVSIEKISICFRGKSAVSWEDTEIDSNEEKHHYARSAEDNICHRSVSLFKRANKISSTPRQNSTISTHDRGWYTYPFRIKIGKGSFPSSFECEFGAIRYWLKAKVIEKSGEQTVEKMITVLERIYIDREEDQRNALSDSSLCQLDSNSGSGFLSADIDHDSYCPGEDIIVKCYAQQSSSDKPLTGIKATLTQTIRLTDNEQVIKKVHYEIAKIEDNAFGRSNERFWQNQRLSIPPMSASIKCGTIICVTFTVTIILTISEGYDLSFRIPITIGTVPRNIIRESGSKKTTIACLPVFRIASAGMKTFKPHFSVTPFASTMDFLPLTCFVENGIREADTKFNEQFTIIRDVQCKAKPTTLRDENVRIKITSPSDDEGTCDNGYRSSSFSDVSADEKCRTTSESTSEADDVFEERQIKKRERAVSQIYVRPKQRSVSIN